MKRLLQFGLLLAALAWCVPAHAVCSNTSLGNGATCIQIASNSTAAAGAATLAVTLTVGAGHFLWVGAGTACATGASSVAGNSNTYVQIGADLVWVAGSKMFAYYVKSANSGSTTVTVTFGCTGQFQTLYVVEYSGLDTAAPLDQNTTFTTASNANPIVTGSLNTLSANEILLAQAVINNVGTGTLTAGTNYTLEGTNANNSGVYEDRGVSATGTYTASFASSATAQAAGVIFATFKTPSTPVAPTDDTYTVMLLGFGMAALVGRLWNQSETEQALLPSLLPTVQPEMFMDSTWGAWRAFHANKPDEDEPGFLGAPAVSIVDDGEFKLDANWRARQYEDTDTARGDPPTPPFAIVDDGENGPNEAWSATRYDHTAETDEPGGLGPPFPPTIQDDQELQKNISVAAPALDDDHSFNPIAAVTAPSIGLDDEAHTFRIYDRATPAVEDDLNTATPVPPLTSDDEAAAFKPTEQATRYLEEENRELPPAPPSTDEADPNVWTATAARQPDDSENYKTPTIVVVATQGFDEIESTFKPQEQASRISDDTATERDLPPTPPNADQDADPSLWTGQTRPIVEDDQLPSPPAPIVIRTASDDEQMMWTDTRKPALEDDQRNSAPTPPVSIVDDGEHKLDSGWRARQHDDTDTQRSSAPTPPTVVTDDGENKINAEWRQNWHEDTETHRAIPPTPPQVIIDDGVNKHDYTWRFFLHDPETQSPTAITPPFVQTIGRDDDVQIFSGYQATFDTQREVLVFIQSKGRSYFYLLDA